MSRTKRKDEKDVEGKRPDLIFMGEVFKNDIPDWKIHRDRKKWGKPNKKFKEIKKAQRKAKEKQVLRNIKDIDDVNFPRNPKTDCWEWN